MSSVFKIFIAMLIAALSFGSIACDSEESESYDLTVNWNISGLEVCQTPLPVGEYAQDELIFEEVEINIYSDAELTTAVQAGVTVPCDSFNYEFTRLARGKYYITVDAIADYDGAELAFFQGSVEVSVPADDDEVAIQLMVGTGDVAVTWSFDGGLTCGIEMAGEVDSIVVDLLGEDEQTVACGDGQLVIENVGPGSGNELTLKGLDVDGEVIYIQDFADNPFEVLPGESVDARVVFE